jgi:hypothetical protein
MYDEVLEGAQIIHVKEGILEKDSTMEIFLRYHSDVWAGL